MKKLLFMMFILTSLSCLSSCSKEDDFTITKSDYVLYHDEKATISGTGNFDKLVWNSDNDFVATITGGTISANTIGTTSIVASAENLKINVTVKPKHNLYEEPDISWGTSMSSIKSKYGTPYSSSSSSLLYKTNNSYAPYILYGFTNGKLSLSSVVLKNSTYVVDKIADFLLERYIPITVDAEDLTAGLLHCKGKKNSPVIDYMVVVDYYQETVKAPVVIYAPYSKNKTMSSPTVENEYLIKVDNYLKALSFN